MAVGTLGSRLTGFLRTIVQSAALGGLGIAAAYNLSNTLPNVVYNLALGGILTSVIVPLIVNAAKRDADRGSGYDQRMFTLVTAALAAVTLVATIAAVPILHLYAGSKITDSPTTLHLSIVFALFFIPQIFFYGVSSLIGAILNSRGSLRRPHVDADRQQRGRHRRPGPLRRGCRCAQIPRDDLRLRDPAARRRDHARHHRADRRAGAGAAPGRIPLAASGGLPPRRGR